MSKYFLLLNIELIFSKSVPSKTEHLETSEITNFIVTGNFTKTYPFPSKTTETCNVRCRSGKFVIVLNCYVFLSTNFKNINRSYLILEILQIIILFNLLDVGYKA